MSGREWPYEKPQEVSEKSVTRASAMGHALSKTEIKTVTVTRAP